eukprot:2408866-Karenia_brevis.AAC.1
MNARDRCAITEKADKVYYTYLYDFNAEEVSPIRRPRLYWLSWQVYQNGPLHVGDTETNYDLSNLSDERRPLKLFLGKGVVKAGDKAFPTSVRWIERNSPPPVPAGLDGCDEATVKKWKESGYAIAPYQFKKENGVLDNGKERPLNALE